MRYFIVFSISILLLVTKKTYSECENIVISVSGSFVNTRNEPSANALVKYTHTICTQGGLMSKIDSTRTDQLGRFNFASISVAKGDPLCAAIKSYSLCVAGDGILKFSGNLGCQEPGSYTFDAIQVPLCSVVTVRGKISDACGVPMGNVMAILSYENYTDEFSYQTAFLNDTTYSDAEGFYVFPNRTVVSHKAFSLRIYTNLCSGMSYGGSLSPDSGPLIVQDFSLPCSTAVNNFNRLRPNVRIDNKRSELLKLAHVQGKLPSQTNYIYDIHGRLLHGKISNTLHQGVYIIYCNSN